MKLPARVILWDLQPACWDEGEEEASVHNDVRRSTVRSRPPRFARKRRPCLSAPNARGVASPDHRAVRTTLEMVGCSRAEMSCADTFNNTESIPEKKETLEHLFEQHLGKGNYYRDHLHAHIIAHAIDSTQVAVLGRSVASHSEAPTSISAESSQPATPEPTHNERNAIKTSQFTDVTTHERRLSNSNPGPLASPHCPMPNRPSDLRNAIRQPPAVGHHARPAVRTDTRKDTRAENPSHGPTAGGVASARSSPTHSP